jgi:putative membrane protein
MIRALENIGGQWGGGYGPGMMGGYGMGHGMGWFGFIFMIAFGVLVAVAIVLLIRWLILSTRPAGRGEREENTSLDILRERYARGEIGREEFEEKKRDLK